MTNVRNIVAQLDASPRLPYALRSNIVAQLDASPRLPYALRSNPRILFSSFLAAGSSQSEDDVSHVGSIKLNKDGQPPFRSHTLRSG
jgi:hypothetical protein